MPEFYRRSNEPPTVTHVIDSHFPLARSRCLDKQRAKIESFGRDPYAARGIPAILSRFTLEPLHFDPIRSPDNGLHGHKCETIGQQESEFQL